MPKYCTSTVVSVAMKAERFGFQIHGHDVKITVCLETRGILNLSELHWRLEHIASRFDHKPLWETLCVEDPLLEHLAASVLSELLTYYDNSIIFKSWVEVETPEGRIIVSGEEASRYNGVAGECS